MRAHAVQTILSDPQTLYKLWRNVTDAPRWMEYVVSVEVKSPTVTHWVMGDPEEPNGKRIEYDTEVIEDVPGERIAWKSITEGIEETGEVLFETDAAGRGTRVTLRERAKIPGGKVGNVAAGLARRTPKQIVIEDLRHFKQLAEAGEIPTVSKNPHGPRGVSGGFKKRMYGENNPTPPGTSNLGPTELTTK
jgi:uncharacterized membrane protein